MKIIQAWTVVYDGQCRMCGRLVRLLQRWDRKDLFEIIPFQDISVPSRFPWIPAQAFREAMQLVGPRNQTWAGAPAIEQMLTLLPAGWLFGWAFRIPLLGRLIDRFYRWFALRRYHFGCGDHCAFENKRHVKKPETT